MSHDFWINRRTLLQDIALSSLDYNTRQIVKRVIEKIPHIDLLERDKGKEPVLETKKGSYHQLNADGTGEFKTREYTDWMCPTCGWFVGELYSGFGQWHIQGETSYCARCGQRIDWTKPDEEEKRRYEERKERERKERQYKLDNMHEGLRRKYGMLGENND